MARERSVACEELENYFAKGYYVVIKCAHSQIYEIIFTFLSNDLVWREKRTFPFLIISLLPCTV